jgi:hypothetical protein
LTETVSSSTRTDVSPAGSLLADTVISTHPPAERLDATGEFGAVPTFGFTPPQPRDEQAAVAVELAAEQFERMTATGAR